MGNQVPFLPRNHQYTAQMLGEPWDCHKGNTWGSAEFKRKKKERKTPFLPGQMSHKVVIATDNHED